MAKSKFVVEGDFNHSKKATVTIDRGTGVMTVRPLHQRVTYALPLSDVALRVMWACIRAETGT
jgi:hypothetical protein